MSIKRYRKIFSASDILIQNRLKRNKNPNRISFTSSNKKLKSSPKFCSMKESSSKPPQQSTPEYNEEQYVDKQDKEDVSDFEKQVHIYLARGLDLTTHSRVWHYILVNEDNHEAFLSKAKTLRTMELTEYGKVLYSGWGMDPPLHVVRKVSIEPLLLFFQKGLYKLGLNCTAIKRTDAPER